VLCHERDRHGRRPDVGASDGADQSGSERSGLGPRPAGLPGTTAAVIRETSPVLQASPPAGTPRRKTAHPGPSPAGEWMLSGFGGFAGSIRRSIHLKILRRAGVPERATIIEKNDEPDAFGRGPLDHRPIARSPAAAKV